MNVTNGTGRPIVLCDAAGDRLLYGGVSTEQSPRSPWQGHTRNASWIIVKLHQLGRARPPNVYTITPRLSYDCHSRFSTSNGPFMMKGHPFALLLRPKRRTSLYSDDGGVNYSINATEYI